MSMHQRLNNSIPSKTRKVKDNRLDTSAGKIWSEASVRVALEERLTKAQEVAKKKLEKQKKTAASLKKLDLQKKPVKRLEKRAKPIGRVVKQTVIEALSSEPK